MRRSRSVVPGLVLTLMVAATACQSVDDGTAGPTATSSAPAPTRDGGTVTVGAEQFPADLNVRVATTNSAGTGRTAGVALARGFRIRPDSSFEPWLFDGDCRVTPPSGTTPYTVSCRIVGAARWSDGTDLTASDFEFTAATVKNPANRVLNRQGFRDLDRIVVKGPKEFDMVFTTPFPAWRMMWATAGGATLPKHVLDGADFNTVWRDCICVPSTRAPIGSGPFLVESFTPETGPLVLARNNSYWASRPKLDKVVFRPIASVDAQATAFRAREVDVIAPSTATAVHRSQVEGTDGAVFQQALGTTWEHIDFNTEKGALERVEVRRAIATALPRRQIVDRLVRPIHDNAVVLQSVVYMTNQADYQPHWQIYPEMGDPGAAKQILERAGWRLDGDVYAMNDVRLQFTLSVNADNQPRQQAAAIIAEQLARAGIAIEVAQVRNAVTDAATGNYEMVLFSWVGGADPGGTSFWRNDIPAPESQNVTRLKSDALTALVKEADVEVDPVKRAALYNRLDDLLAREHVSSIPLYQRPQPLAHQGSLVGLVVNATIDGFTWNIGDWALRA